MKIRFHTIFWWQNVRDEIKHIASIFVSYATVYNV